MSEVNGKKMFYRLRSLKSIFEYEELEKQEIYLASIEELNDPMEGFRNIVFKESDEDDWETLFKHYLLCFEWIYIMSDISIDACVIGQIIKYGCTLNTDKIYKDFFQISGKVIDKIASRTTPIDKNELLFYLEYINPIVLELMHKYYNPSKNKRLSNNFDNTIDKIIQKIDEIEKHINNTKNQESTPQVIDKIKSETRFMYSSLNMLNTTEISENNFSLFVALDFPNFYLETLEKLMYPESYIACFMEKIRNSSLWGHYGDGHKGICLIFKAINNSLVMSDKKTIIKFEKVIYDCDARIVNLFEVLNNNSQKSPEKLYEGLHIKTVDWRDENEYRIIGHATEDINQINKQNRKLKYQFKDLYGIIFGMATSKKDKIRIINILKQKCIRENRRDFKIYQANYCLKNKKMWYSLLMTLDDTEREKPTL